MCKQWHVSCKQPTHGAFFRVVNRLFSTTGSQLPLAPGCLYIESKDLVKIVWSSLSHPSILGVTLCFCTGSYAAAAAARRRRPPQILVHAITFEQLFGFLSFLAQLLALTCRLPDYIFVDFRRDLDLDFSRSNMEFAISQPKMVRLPRNEKQT